MPFQVKGQSGRDVSGDRSVSGRDVCLLASCSAESSLCHALPGKQGCMLHGVMLGQIHSSSESHAKFFLYKGLPSRTV